VIAAVMQIMTKPFAIEVLGKKISDMIQR